jgi:hypothetical protein
MDTVKMPGFSAEASLYTSKGRYLSSHSIKTSGMENSVTAARGHCCVRCGWGHDWCCEDCWE